MDKGWAHTTCWKTVKKLAVTVTLVIKLDTEVIRTRESLHLSLFKEIYSEEKDHDLGNPDGTDLPHNALHS
jgi:hypothetical protein